MARFPDDYEDGDGKWYFSREEIEENSPSRRHGITLEKETRFRKTYCTFLHDLGVKIEVPQLAIATATLYCHRFFHRVSHANHDRRQIATSCLFLASKVECTPKPLRSVVLASYELIHRMDSVTVARIFKKEGVFEKERRSFLQRELLVLDILKFDTIVRHPYKPLVLAIKKFVGYSDIKDLVQVLWNFVNDGLNTSLSLQYKPRKVAAAAFFLAAEYLNIKPHFGWRREFAITRSQLRDICNQILKLYDIGRGSRASQAKASGAETSAPKVLDGGDNASTDTVVAQATAHNLDGSDSEKNKFATGQSNHNHDTLMTDFEPKGQEVERIETLEQKKDSDPKAEQKERIDTLEQKDLIDSKGLGAETSASKVLDTGDNASSGTVVGQSIPHNLDDSDSEKHKIASDQINYDKQSTEPGHSSPNHDTLTIDFEPKRQEVERIETLEQKDFDPKAEQEDRIETLEQKDFDPKCLEVERIQTFEKEEEDVAVNLLSPATIERFHKKFKATMEEPKKSEGSNSSRVRVSKTEEEMIETLLENGIDF